MIYHFVAGTSFRPMVEDQRGPKFDRCNPSQSEKTGSGSHRLTNNNNTTQQMSKQQHQQHQSKQQLHLSNLSLFIRAYTKMFCK